MIQADEHTTQTKVTARSGRRSGIFNFDLLVLSAGRAIQMIIGVLTIRVLTSVLSPDEVGRYYILITLVFGFNFVFLAAVSQYMGVKLLEWVPTKSARPNHLAFAKYNLGVVVVVAVIATALHQTVGVGIAIAIPWLIFLVCGNLLFSTWNALCTTGLNILGHRVQFVVFANLTVGVGLGISTLLTMRISASAEYWVSGLFLGQTIVLVLAGPLFWRYLVQPIRERDVAANSVDNIAPRTVFRFAWPLSVSMGLNWVQWQSYLFILVSVHGENVVGLFAVGYTVIAAVVMAYEVLFSQFYIPTLYNDIADQDSSGRAEAWNRYANLYLPSIVVTVAFVAAGGPFLAKLMVGSQFYSAAVTVAPMAAIAEGARLICSAYNMAAFAQLDMRTVIWPTLAGVTLTVAGVLILSRWSPLIGTGLALILGGAATAVLLSIKLHRVLSLRLPGKRLFWSLVVCLPFVAVSSANWVIQPSPTMAGAVLSLTILGVYFFIAQFGFARSASIMPESNMTIGRLLKT